MKNILTAVAMLLFLPYTYTGRVAVIGDDWSMDVRVEVLQRFRAPIYLDADITLDSKASEGVYKGHMIYHRRGKVRILPVRVIVEKSKGDCPAQFNFLGNLI